ncbi:MAG TPA: dihydropyrimidinase, partial [Candidatus Acetothermia bacterium]|nr:dihydropyrimidinase [Candidatus Acetothermia bacterium]
MAALLITEGTVVAPRRVAVADILVRDGKIARVGKVAAQAEAFSARGLLVLPGAIDAHVHLALPVAGTQSTDGWASGTRAAAAGGVTTVVDFTLGSPDVPLP